MKPINHSIKLRQLLIVFLIVFSNGVINAQLDWTEHLSHDRLTRNNLGFLFEENNLILVMDNNTGAASTIERITGNSSKEVISEFDFNYESRSTVTGKTSKEVMLIKPESLDIYGFGATSIRMTDGTISVRSLESLIEFPCADAIIPIDVNESAECLTNYDFDHLILNNNGDILATYDASPMTLHEGLEENYRVQNDNLYVHDGNTTTFLFEVPNFKKLYNNPFTEELVVVLDSTIIKYDPITFEVEETILETEPIAIDFTEDAMYYLSKVGNGYKIFKNYYSGGTNLWMDIDPTPNGQEVVIQEISIKDLDAYLFGIHYNELTKTKHHIVQKVNLLAPIGPSRKDLAILSFSATYEELDYEKYKYTYEIDVVNNGTSVVNTFNVYSDLQEYNELYFTQINQAFNGILQPNQEVTLQGSFIAKSMSEININIPGADFMFDSYPNDNSGTFDLISSTTTDIKSTVSISPNPTTGILNVELSNSDQTTVYVFDIFGRKVLTPNVVNSKIDITSLPNGLFYLQILNKNLKTTQTVIKI
jgi:hypothetical protein